MDGGGGAPDIGRGTVAGPVCLECERPIRTNNRPIPCLDCGGETHSSCTGLTRAQTNRGIEYKCRRCRGGEMGAAAAPAVVAAPNAEGDVEGGRCGVCTRPLRRGSRPIKCRTCPLVVHRQCTRLRRGRADEGWRCDTCRGAERGEAGAHQQEGRTERAPPKNRKCPSCKRNLAKTSPRCVGCARGFHLACVRETRRATEIMRNNNTWKCHDCREAERAEETPLDNRPQTDNPSNSDLALAGGSKQEGIKIIQWNCDFLMTKLDELQELAHREEADVVVVQETKLGVNDPTPTLKGYSSIRKDRAGSGTICDRGGGLVTFVRNGLAHWEEPLQTKAIEGQIVCFPTDAHHVLSIVNVYIRPQ